MTTTYTIKYETTSGIPRSIKNCTKHMAGTMNAFRVWYEDARGRRIEVSDGFHHSHHRVYQNIVTINNRGVYRQAGIDGIAVPN